MRGKRKCGLRIDAAVLDTLPATAMELALYGKAQSVRLRSAIAVARFLTAPPGPGGVVRDAPGGPHWVATAPASGDRDRAVGPGGGGDLCRALRASSRCFTQSEALVGRNQSVAAVPNASKASLYRREVTRAAAEAAALASERDHTERIATQQRERAGREALKPLSAYRARVCRRFAATSTASTRATMWRGTTSSPARRLCGRHGNWRRISHNAHSAALGRQGARDAAAAWLEQDARCPRPPEHRKQTAAGPVIANRSSGCRNASSRWSARRTRAGCPPATGSMPVAAAAA